MKLRFLQQGLLLGSRSITRPCWLSDHNLSVNASTLRSITSFPDHSQRLTTASPDANENSQSASTLQFSRPLPLSPLMDPRMIEAREKHRAPKPPSCGVLTPLQNKLKRNPYASALESSLRLCIITHTRLPESFLLRYHLVFHPETGDPWYLPANLDMPTEISETTAILGQKPEANLEAPSKNILPAQPMVSLSRLRGPNSLVLARADLLIENANPVRKKKKGTFTWQKLNQKHAEQIGLKPVIWREDMPAFVLGLLRRRVRLKLLKLAKRGTSINTCQNWSEIVKKKQAACVLWLEHLPGATKIHDHGPAPYATTTSASGNHIVIYNLPRLLGAELVEEVRSAFCPNGRAEAVVLKSWKSNREPQECLWKLEGYISELGDQEDIIK